MEAQNRNIDQPLMFWLINEFAGADEAVEETRPIGNREFALWMGILSAALLAYGVVFRFLA